jgi:hypothetical protein
MIAKYGYNITAIYILITEINILPQATITKVSWAQTWTHDQDVSANDTDEELQEFAHTIRDNAAKRGYALHGNVYALLCAKRDAERRILASL